MTHTAGDRFVIVLCFKEHVGGVVYFELCEEMLVLLAVCVQEMQHTCSKLL